MNTSCLAAGAVFLCLAGLPARAEEPAAPLGKQRAAASRLAWDVRDQIHHRLGAVRSAVLRTLYETPVGNAKIHSQVTFACEKAGDTFAIELRNGTSANEPHGLKPNDDPRLFCSRPIQPWDEKLVQEEILAHWEVSRGGDALTWGLRPFPLRECVSIRVVQELDLPEGWSQKKAHLEFDIFPYARELDSVFVGCGEHSAYGTEAPKPTLAQAPVPKAPVAQTPAPKPPVVQAPAPAPPPKPPVAQATAVPDGWLEVRVLSHGRTNVRAGATLQSAVVAQLYPGAAVLVQKTGTEWWRARSAMPGAKFEGYIRQDRLDFN